MMDEVLNRLIDVMESAAPELWLAATKQVQAMVVANIMWVVLFAVLLVGCFAAFWYMVRKHSSVCQADKEDYEWLMFAVVVFSIAGAICVFFLTKELVGLLIAPEYHAIEQLLKLVQ